MDGRRARRRPARYIESFPWPKSNAFRRAVANTPDATMAGSPLTGSPLALVTNTEPRSQRCEARRTTRREATLASASTAITMSGGTNASTTARQGRRSAYDEELRIPPQHREHWLAHAVGRERRQVREPPSIRKELQSQRLGMHRLLLSRLVTRRSVPHSRCSRQGGRAGSQPRYRAPHRFRRCSVRRGEGGRRASRPPRLHPAS